MVYVLIAVLVLIVVFVGYEFFTAPLGHEDETGFHNDENHGVSVEKWD